MVTRDIKPDKPAMQANRAKVTACNFTWFVWDRDGLFRGETERARIPSALTTVSGGLGDT
jgi:hypothetical protein